MLLATGLLTTACLQRHDQRRSLISPVGPVVNDGGHDSNKYTLRTVDQSSSPLKLNCILLHKYLYELVVGLGRTTKVFVESQLKYNHKSKVEIVCAGQHTKKEGVAIRLTMNVGSPKGRHLARPSDWGSRATFRSSSSRFHVDFLKLRESWIFNVSRSSSTVSE
jgi:hypothetical protein